MYKKCYHYLVQWLLFPRPFLPRMSRSVLEEGRPAWRRSWTGMAGSRRDNTIRKMRDPFHSWSFNCFRFIRSESAQLKIQLFLYQLFIQIVKRGSLTKDVWMMMKESQVCCCFRKGFFSFLVFFVRKESLCFHNSHFAETHKKTI